MSEYQQICKLKKALSYYISNNAVVFIESPTQTFAGERRDKAISVARLRAGK